jgi:hypothetical protein
VLLGQPPVPQVRGSDDLRLLGCDTARHTGDPEIEKFLLWVGWGEAK